MYKAFFDGASQGNPGASGIGYVIINLDGEIISEQSIPIGVKTNNEAEYIALIFLLRELRKQDIQECNIYSDSQLVVNQVNCDWQINKPHLYTLCAQAQSLLLPNHNLYWIRREKNELADNLSKRALETPIEKAVKITEKSNAHSYEPKEIFDGIFLVQSSDREKIYVIDTYNDACTCPAFVMGKTRPCKHMLAVEEYHLQNQLLVVQKRKQAIANY